MQFPKAFNSEYKIDCLESSLKGGINSYVAIGSKSYLTPIRESWKKIQKPRTELASFLKKKIQRKLKKSGFEN